MPGSMPSGRQVQSCGLEFLPSSITDVSIVISSQNNNLVTKNLLKKMQAIGNTPLIKLERLSEPGCADIYVKYEGANPTGSMKDQPNESSRKPPTPLPKFAPFTKNSQSLNRRDFMTS